MIGWRARLGITTAAQNRVIEPEFYAIAPKGVAIYTSRILWESSTVTEEAIIKASEAAVTAAQEVAQANVDLIGYTGTGMSMIKGRDYEREIVERIESKTGIPTVTTGGAVVSALKELGMSNICVATPYAEWQSQKIKTFLEQHGFTVINLEGLGITKRGATGDLEPSTSYRKGKAVYRQEADGVFISCSNWRTIEIINALERDIGKPVVSASIATFWHMFRRAGIKEPIKGFGTLLELH